MSTFCEGGTSELARSNIDSYVHRMPAILGISCSMQICQEVFGLFYLVVQRLLYDSVADLAIALTPADFLHCCFSTHICRGNMGSATRVDSSSNNLHDTELGLSSRQHSAAREKMSQTTRAEIVFGPMGNLHGQSPIDKLIHLILDSSLPGTVDTSAELAGCIIRGVRSFYLVKAFHFVL